jgi:hypothetical protein
VIFWIVFKSKTSGGFILNRTKNQKMKGIKEMQTAISTQELVCKQNNGRYDFTAILDIHKFPSGVNCEEPYDRFGSCVFKITARRMDRNMIADVTNLDYVLNQIVYCVIDPDKELDDDDPTCFENSTLITTIDNGRVLMNTVSEVLMEPGAFEALEDILDMDSTVKWNIVPQQ